MYIHKYVCITYVTMHCICTCVVKELYHSRGARLLWCVKEYDIEFSACTVYVNKKSSYSTVITQQFHSHTTTVVVTVIAIHVHVN